MYPFTTFLFAFVTANLLATMKGLPQPWLDSYEIAEQITMNTSAIEHASVDYGNMTQVYPAAVLLPTSDDVIAKLIRSSYESPQPFRVSARGQGHSIHGQAQARSGVVVEMRSLHLHGSTNSREYGSNFDACYGSGPAGDCYVDVGGGQLWIEVLRSTTEHGLAPRTWTDYLYLTVGGTLSNAGVSGQAFRHGPQISNVLEMDVITGKGEMLTCSPMQNSDLFYAVLGGLGQFGIITRARIALQKAPHMVRWMRLGYSNFSKFTKDQEHLISLNCEERDKCFDYVEGLIVRGDESGCNGGFNSTNWRLSSFEFPRFTATNNTFFYCLEVAKYYTNSTDQHHVDEEVERLIKDLHYIPGMASSKDVTYVHFLDRVHQDELQLRSRGQWNVPHPWLCLFVPATRILEFHDVVFEGILFQNNASGPMLSYPLNRNKWDQRMSAVVPTEEVFYSVGLLRSAMNDWEFYEEQNKQILKKCEERQIEAKMYLPYYRDVEEWRRHFGEEGWATFLERKAKFDPRGILATGQKIFPFALAPSFFQNSTVLKQ